MILAEEWRERAACNGKPTALFFPVTEKGEAAPKEVCGTCPVTSECLEYALTTRQEDGIWGGLSEAERRRLRRRGRPRQRASYAIRDCARCGFPYLPTGASQKRCDVCRYIPREDREIMENAG